MENKSPTTSHLIFGLAVAGLALAVAGVRLYRRSRAGSAAGRSQVKSQGEAGAGAEEPGLPVEPADDRQVGLPVYQKAPAGASQQNIPRDFFLLVLVLAVPFYLFGGRKLPLPVNLPASALMFLCTFTAALYLSYRQSGIDGIQRLLKRAVDYKKIKNKIWYLPSLFLMPLIYAISYVIMRWIGKPLPDPQIPLLVALAFLVGYLIEAPLEELGFMGVAYDPMQDRWGALKAAVLLGTFWQLWHLIPLIQAHHSANWIVWHILEGIALRILMAWVYNNTGKSVFTSILMHATTNVAWTMFPNFGSAYDPFFTAVIIWFVTALVVLVWGSRSTVNRRKNGPNIQNKQHPVACRRP